MNLSEMKERKADLENILLFLHEEDVNWISIIKQYPSLHEAIEDELNVLLSTVNKNIELAKPMLKLKEGMRIRSRSLSHEYLVIRDATFNFQFLADNNKLHVDPKHIINHYYDGDFEIVATINKA